MCVMPPEKAGKMCYGINLPFKNRMVKPFSALLQKKCKKRDCLCLPLVSSNPSVIIDHPFLHPDCFRQGQSAVHHVGRGHLGRKVQMTVDVCRGTDITVTKPLLDLLRGHAVGEQQRGTAVSEVVKTDMPQSVSGSIKSFR